jgi:hypothetical protein
MSTASITQAQGKGLRQFFAEAAKVVRDFSIAMYAARDREFAAREANLFAAPVVTPREKQQSRMKLLSLASQSEAHSPSLAAELRNVAGRG